MMTRDYKIRKSLIVNILKRKFEYITSIREYFSSCLHAFFSFPIIFSNQIGISVCRLRKNSVEFIIFTEFCHFCVFIVVLVYHSNQHFKLTYFPDDSNLLLHSTHISFNIHVLNIRIVYMN